jgi:hypothetical protein
MSSMLYNLFTPLLSMGFDITCYRNLSYFLSSIIHFFIPSQTLVFYSSIVPSATNGLHRHICMLSLNAEI